MESKRFDDLSRVVASGLTRRGVLGWATVLGLGSLVEGGAKKRRKKKKKKCKKGTKKCGSTCISSTSCCSSADCEAGESCQNGACTAPPNPCDGQPDATPCGESTQCDSPFGVCGDFCSGSVCAQIPTCNGSTHPCGDECCDPAGASCSSSNLCGCSGIGNPCYTSDDCCGDGVCVGFVCELP